MRPRLSKETCAHEELDAEQGRRAPGCVYLRLHELAGGGVCYDPIEADAQKLIDSPNVLVLPFQISQPSARSRSSRGHSGWQLVHSGCIFTLE